MNENQQLSGDGLCSLTSGVVSMRSAHTVHESVARIVTVLSNKGVKLFATIDHSSEARAIGIAMPPTVVMIFGDPRAGTPLMLAAPSIALDLPLKILVSEDANGAVWMSYVAPSLLQIRHSLPQELTKVLEGVETIVMKMGDSGAMSGAIE